MLFLNPAGWWTNSWGREPHKGLHCRKMNAAVQGKSTFSRIWQGWEAFRAQQAELAAPREMRAGKCWEALGTQQHFKESQHHWVGWDPQGSSPSKSTGLLKWKPTHFSAAAPSKGNWFMTLASLNWMLPYEWCWLFLMLPDAFSPSSWMALSTAPFYSMYTFPRVFCEDLSCLEAEGAQSIHMPSQSPAASSSLLGTPHPTGVNLRRWSKSWTSRKIKENSSENQGFTLQKFSTYKPTTEVRGVQASDKQSTTHPLYEGKSDLKPEVSGQSSPTLTSPSAATQVNTQTDRQTDIFQ